MAGGRVLGQPPRQLHDGDPQTAREISEGSFRWEDQVVHVQGRGTARLSGHGFSTSRQRLLDILAKRAMDLGVQVRFERGVEGLSQFADSDLIVACDGVNSRLRRLHADKFIEVPLERLLQQQVLVSPLKP
jgi:2-polyprenyl-6-methoxyphenol hydroxylase-like FAD-dependent oxidoreductase